MYEVKQAALARAIDILRSGPMTAAAFAARMWPDRRNEDGGERTRSQLSHAGHAFLRRLGALGYAVRVGDLWMIRQFSASGSSEQSADMPAILSATNIPNGLQNGSANHPPNGLLDSQADRLRLARLVGQATEPVATVTHDAALGNLAIRGCALDAALVEGCALTVLSGQNMNIYPPCGAPRMLVGLEPAEAARALYLRWQQSGQPPELPRPSAWIVTADGLVASSSYWRPIDASASWVDPEDVCARIQRQRAAAGLA
jgi:hypothetical protein